MASPPTRRRASWPIEQLPGLDKPDLTALKQHGISSTGDLLAAARSTPKQQLAATLQVHPQRLAKWVVLAELAQVPGVGMQYCGLLLHAGVSSCAQLAQMPASRLHKNLLRLQVALLQKRELCPTVGEVTQWIQQARLIQR
ncbi:DUF4332 domain-containing protein [Acaryochloris thomasi]|nr:DUF4332 domain-containing protein [Acaryochloris thomasi]